MRAVAVDQSPRRSARLNLRSSSLPVLDEAQRTVRVAPDPDAVSPIASITRLMTAMVVLAANLQPYGKMS